MQRNFINELKKWKESSLRKPLIIQGARQIGKTWIMKEFGRTEYKKTAYIYCQDNPTLENLFNESFNTERILNALQMIVGFKITPEDTLIIFDEIQEIPKALTSLKYFYEQLPEYHIMCAGSLLGITLHNGTNFPVGKVNFMNLYPMTFTEFLIANQKQELADLIQNKNQDKILLTSFKQTYIDMLKLYFFVGGMPEAVLTWIETKDFSLVRKVQKEILLAYENDISKHASTESVNKIKMIWQSIPSQLAKENKKFIYGLVKQGARAREYESSINWLKDAGLLYKIHRITKPNLPLKSYEDLSAFKIYIHDIGLLCSLSGLSAKTLLENDRLFTEFKGSLTEQFVLQELIAECEIIPFYWSNDTSTAELDFIVQFDDEIVPIEVKATTNLQAKSLKQFIQKNNTELAFRFSLADYKENEIIKDIPLYDMPIVKFYGETCSCWI